MPSLYIIAFFLLLNLLWIIALWSIGFSSDKLIPKYISSSFEPNSNYEFESVVLNSLCDVFSDYFPPPNIITKHIGDLPNGNYTYNYSKEYENEIEKKLKRLYNKNLIINKTNSKYEIIVDINEKILKIVKLFTNYRTYKSEIRLFYLPLDNFIISQKQDFDIFKSIIVEAWKMDFPGEIKDYRLSFDKKNILLNYIVSKNNIITKRFRYASLNISNSYYELISNQSKKLNS